MVKKPRYFQHQYQKQVKILAFISWLVSRKVWIHSQTIFLWHGEKQKQPPECSVGEGVLWNFAKFLGKHLCQSLLFDKVAVLRKKETLTRVFSCEFCEIFKNTFFTEHLWTTASKHQISTRVNQKKTKSSRNDYVMCTCFKFWLMKNIFRKL